ncbi:MAG: hypothetical protein COA79_23745, partial [Planctomycetota bacterium]
MSTASTYLSKFIFTLTLFVLFFSISLISSDKNIFKIKRENIFKFIQKPTVKIDKDTLIIKFETKAFCDVSVAIEDDNGKILRHLGSGVLGNKVPKPFTKNSKKQKLIWDGKNDQGKYVTKDKNNFKNIRVRVSLGLKPVFEKRLFWSPHKRLTVAKAITGDAIRMCSSPEGVYVSDGTGVDSIRLFNHEGDYVRTIYPFSGDNLDKIKGLDIKTFPQDNKKLPLGKGMMHATLLTSGSSASQRNKYGFAANFIATNADNLAIGFFTLNRLTTDGTTKNLSFEGPSLTQSVKIGPEDMWSRGAEGNNKIVAPRSAAFSPDGKRLYLSGYGWTGVLGRAHEWLNGVTVMNFKDSESPKTFVGSMKQKERGKKDGQFNWATSVAIDSKENVYVSDYFNNRIQIFSKDKIFIKSFSVEQPTFVGVHHKTNEIYVLSWRLGSGHKHRLKTPLYSRFGSIDNPTLIKSYALKVLNGYNYRSGLSSRKAGGGLEYIATLDSWAKEPTIWLAPGKGEPLMLLVERDGKLVIKRDFKRDVIKTVVRVKPPIIQRQRLYVNQKNGLLFIGEGDAGVMKSFQKLVEINPENSKVKIHQLPFDAEDICIDLNGYFYLRTDLEVGRFDASNWKEIPFDYGMLNPKVSFGGYDGKTGKLISSIKLPSVGRPAFWHGGGMAISPTGDIAVTCYNKTTQMKIYKGTTPQSTPERGAKRGTNKALNESNYKPQLFIGRQIGWETHIWNKHGQLIKKDVTKGITKSDGINIDKEGNLYVMTHLNQIIDNKPYFISTAGTLIKFKPETSRLLTKGNVGIPLPLKGKQPKRNPDFSNHSWAENTDWFYGGVGLG